MSLEGDLEDPQELEWLVSGIKFVAMGVSSPIIFLWQVYDKLVKVLTVNPMSRSFRIVNIEEFK